MARKNASRTAVTPATSARSRARRRMRDDARAAPGRVATVTVGHGIGGTGATCAPEDEVLDHSLIQEVLRAALARGGSFAEVFAEERESAAIRLDDGKVEELTSGLDRGAGIRVVRGRSTAYAYSNRLDRGALLEAAGAAAASVRDGEPAHVVDLRRREPGVVHRAERPAGDVP